MTLEASRAVSRRYDAYAPMGDELAYMLGFIIRDTPDAVDRALDRLDQRRMQQ